MPVRIIFPSELAAMREQDRAGQDVAGKIQNHKIAIMEILCQANPRISQALYNQAMRELWSIEDVKAVANGKSRPTVMEGWRRVLKRHGMLRKDDA